MAPMADGAVITAAPLPAGALALALTLAVTAGGAVPAAAATFLLPKDGDGVVGRIQRVAAHEADTLLDIARANDLGLVELTEANPEVDVWLPGEGTPVIVPTRFVLPPGPREGIVVNVAEMRLYYYPPPETPWERRVVITHPVAIGRVGLDTPLGTFAVADKITDPSWTVPKDMAAEYRDKGVPFQAVVPPGPDNPLGSHALVLDRPGYFIHGTNRPWSIGMRVSRGCIRLYPEDIRSLFPEVPQGTPVRIVDLPYKLGREAGVWYLEAHPGAGVGGDGPGPAALLRGAGLEPLEPALGAARAALMRPLGLPRPVTPRRPPPT
jgi:L,D-transpeptidase ErfK/SrfK